jgi:hypothetical protein
MPYRTRKPPIHTAAVCVHMPPQMRSIVEDYATQNHTSLGEAGRLLLEAGAIALGIVEVS